MGDLFSCSTQSSMAHCISKDCRLGKGIAKLFREKFGRIKELESCKAGIGGLAPLQDKSRYLEITFNLTFNVLNINFKYIYHTLYLSSYFNSKTNSTFLLKFNIYRQYYKQFNTWILLMLYLDSYTILWQRRSIQTSQPMKVCARLLRKCASMPVNTR